LSRLSTPVRGECDEHLRGTGFHEVLPAHDPAAQREDAQDRENDENHYRDLPVVLVPRLVAAPAQRHPAIVSHGYSVALWSAIARDVRLAYGHITPDKFALVNPTTAVVAAFVGQLVFIWLRLRFRFLMLWFARGQVGWNLIPPILENCACLIIDQDAFLRFRRLYPGRHWYPYSTCTCRAGRDFTRPLIGNAILLAAIGIRAGEANHRNVSAV